MRKERNSRKKNAYRITASAPGKMIITCIWTSHRKPQNRLFSSGQMWFPCHKHTHTAIRSRAKKRVVNVNVWCVISAHYPQSATVGKTGKCAQLYTITLITPIGGIERKYGSCVVNGNAQGFIHPGKEIWMRDENLAAMGNEIQFGQLCKVKLCVVCHTNSPEGKWKSKFVPSIFN